MLLCEERASRGVFSLPESGKGLQGSLGPPSFTAACPPPPQPTPSGPFSYFHRGCPRPPLLGAVLVHLYSLVGYLVLPVDRRTQASWEENDTFKETLRLSEGKPDFTFYDGPPFATGLPHYGHILAGEI